MSRYLRFRRLATDESGMYTVFVGCGFMAFLAATTLAIDVGMFMTARSQSQNAADAGALAGATALAFNDFDDRSSTGPAVLSAMHAAQANQVMKASPSVLPSDVTFPNDDAGNPTRVAVTVYRTAGRSNPIPTLIGSIFGVSTVNVGAHATAEASPANAERCVLPFTIPDRWVENSDGDCMADGPWTSDSTFDLFATKSKKQNSGSKCSTPDVYIQPGAPGYTGYNPMTDKGLELVLKANNDNKVAPSMYNPWDLPGSVGGDDYRNNIATCNTNIVGMGDPLTPENGNMVGPTKQGVDDLVAKDPGAFWDTSCNCVKGSAYGTSPRIGIIPLYDPELYANGQQTGKAHPDLKAVNFLGFFIEGQDGAGNVLGRITPVAGLIKGGLPMVNSGFPVAIRLVQ